MEVDPRLPRASPSVLFRRRRQAGPTHRAVRQGVRLVATEVPAQWRSVELVQHLRAKRARRRDAKAVDAPGRTQTRSPLRRRHLPPLRAPGPKLGF